MTNIVLSHMQKEALANIVAWLNTPSGKRNPTFYLAGYAGTGKTTILLSLVNQLKSERKDIPLLFAAFTGKAALRMQQTGLVGAQTLHSLIYSYDEESDSFILDAKSALRRAELLIIDEVSMVNKELGNDVLSFGVPVLVVGDPGQLPPVSGAGFFTKRSPDFTLTDIHRQALDSPIISVATAVRNGERLRRWSKDDVNIYPYERDYEIRDMLTGHAQVLCGTNKTRKGVNARMKLSSDWYPVLHDKLICTRNNQNIGVFNGLIMYIQKIHSSNDRVITVDLGSDIGDFKKVKLNRLCFEGDAGLETLNSMPMKQRVGMIEADFGYAITVHKAQGSQWESVLLLDDGFLSWDKRARSRWLYTAITRAEEKLTVVRL